MKLLKKAVSLLTVLIVITSCALCTVQSNASGFLASGTIENKVYWSISDNILTVSKTPWMDENVSINDYATDVNPPWYKYKDDIKHIVMDEYISEIGKFAFYGLSNVKTARIGKNVDKIGTGAFSHCDSMNEFNIESGNTSFKVEEGILFTSNGKELVSFPASKQINDNENGVKEYIIPSTVSTVRAYSFHHNQNIERISNNTPGSVVRINTRAFAFSEKLKTVVIKNNCETIQDKAFYGANALKNVTIPPTVTNIGEYVFSEPESLSNALRIHCAKDSTAYNKFKGNGYILSEQEWTFTVTFNPAEGTASETSKTVIWGNNYGNLPTATKTGYDFAGWYFENQMIQNSTKVTKAQSHTLTAKYNSKQYIVSLDANSGICDTQSVSVSYGSPFGTLPEPSKLGYKFLGWYTQSGDKVYTDTVYTDENISTLFARYIKIATATSGLKIKYKTPNTITLSWNKQEDVTGYEVFQKVNSGAFVSCAIVTDYYTVLTLKAKNSYSYKVRAFVIEGDSTQYGDFSSVVSRRETYLKKPKLKKKVYKNGILSVEWKSVPNAKKYQIFQYKNKKWKKVKTTTATKFYIYTKVHKSYRFKVRAYKTILKHKYYSKFAKIRHRT